MNIQELISLLDEKREREGIEEYSLVDAKYIKKGEAVGELGELGELGYKILKIRTKEGNETPDIIYYSNGRWIAKVGMSTTALNDYTFYIEGEKEESSKEAFASSNLTTNYSTYIGKRIMDGILILLVIGAFYYFARIFGGKVFIDIYAFYLSIGFVILAVILDIGLYKLLGR